MLGKIAHLPVAIREQLNQRLENGKEGPEVRSWLNSLPEVQAILAAHFDGVPISQQNLSDYKTHGFLDWQARRQAMEFAATLNEEDEELQKIFPANLAEKLSRWVSIHYAAATRANLNGTPEDLDQRLRQLRHFCLLILALRRGELSAGRLALEQQRLTMQLSDTATAKEKEFWEWTKRPDIQEKLYPNRDPEKIRQDVVRMLDRELLGIRFEDELDETSEPAALI